MKLRNEGMKKCSLAFIATLGALVLAGCSAGEVSTDDSTAGAGRTEDPPATPTEDRGANGDDGENVSSTTQAASTCGYWRSGNYAYWTTCTRGPVYVKFFFNGEYPIFRCMPRGTTNLGHWWDVHAAEYMGFCSFN